MAETKSENFVTRSEESLAKLYESGLRRSKWMWVVAAVGIAGCLFASGFFLRGYYRNVYVLRAPGQGPLLGIAIFMLIVGVVTVYIAFAYEKWSYVVHSYGLRVTRGKMKHDLRFSDFEHVRIAPWWESITKLATGDPLSKRGIMITLKKKLPFSFSSAMLIGVGSRLIYISHDEPELFLGELNRAWNAWKLTRAEGQSSGQTSSASTSQAA